MRSHSIRMREVDRRIGERVGSFTNRARMRKPLALMAVEMSGRADGRQSADRLRERLHLAGGRPADKPGPARRPEGRPLAHRLRDRISIRIE